MADNHSIYCPGCHKHTSITTRKHYQDPKNHTYSYQIAECNSCDTFLLTTSFLNKITKVDPSPLPKPLHEKTPEFLIQDLEESLLCFSVGAYRATGVLARRALQLCCVEKGAPDKKLQEQIDWLLDEQIITKDLKEWAHEVRLTGNDAAHPPKKVEDDERVEKDDAEDILTLLEKFVDVLYIAPALAEERKQKRTAPTS